MDTAIIDDTNPEYNRWIMDGFYRNTRGQGDRTIPDHVEDEEDWNVPVMNDRIVARIIPETHSCLNHGCPVCQVKVDNPDERITECRIDVWIDGVMLRGMSMQCTKGTTCESIRLDEMLVTPIPSGRMHKIEVMVTSETGRVLIQKIFQTEFSDESSGLNVSTQPLTGISEQMPVTRLILISDMADEIPVNVVLRGPNNTVHRKQMTVGPGQTVIEDIFLEDRDPIGRSSHVTLEVICDGVMVYYEPFIVPTGYPDEGHNILADCRFTPIIDPERLFGFEAGICDILLVNTEGYEDSVDMSVWVDDINVRDSTVRVMGDGSRMVHITCPIGCLEDVTTGDVTVVCHMAEGGRILESSSTARIRSEQTMVCIPQQMMMEYMSYLGGMGLHPRFQDQTISKPSEVFGSKNANMFEMTLIVGSIMRMVGLRPVMVALDGHCLIGAITPTTEGTTDTEDLCLEAIFAEGIRMKMILFDPTACLAGGPSFEKATKGAETLAREQWEYIISHGYLKTLEPSEDQK